MVESIRRSSASVFRLVPICSWRCLNVLIVVLVSVANSSAIDSTISPLIAGVTMVAWYCPPSTAAQFLLLNTVTAALNAAAVGSYASLQTLSILRHDQQRWWHLFYN